jgi:hypothetical protein
VQLDPIERFVQKLFGKQALEDRAPAGMQRLSEDALKVRRASAGYAGCSGHANTRCHL